MGYRILTQPGAQRDLAELELDLRQRAVEAIHRIGRDAADMNHRFLEHGLHPFCKHYLADKSYRIIYRVDHRQERIVNYLICPRKLGYSRIAAILRRR